MPKPALVTLIKLAQREVEAIQQKLARNQAEQVAQQAVIAQWQQAAQQAFTRAAADNNVLEMQAAGLFQGRARSEIARAEEHIATLKEAGKNLHKALQEAFLKEQRYQVLYDQQQHAAKQQAGRKAQAALDDLRRKT